MGYYDDTDMKGLEGKTIIGLRIGADESLLVFDTPEGHIAYAARGDCCSESWFADINGISALIGGTVQSAETIPLDNYNVDDGRTRQEYDEAYGWKLTTNRGYVDIVMRNSSNGYYGGWISLYENDLPEGLRDISGYVEWQA